MKKIVIISLVLLFFLGGFSFAQETDYEPSDMFVKTMPITKIYTHKLGYKVVYLKTDLNFAEFYVPLEWFDVAGQKAVIVKGVDPAFPYFSIFWKEGAFHSVKLYVRRDLQHPSWGTLTESNVQEKFNIDEPELEF